MKILKSFLTYFWIFLVWLAAFAILTVVVNSASAAIRRGSHSVPIFGGEFCLSDTSTFVNAKTMTLDGSDEYLLVPRTKPLDNLANAFTYSLWFNTSDETQYGVILDQTIGGTAATQVAIYLDGSVVNARVINNVGGQENLVSDGAPSTDAWVHVALTYDGSTITMYVDGSAQADTEAHTAPVRTGAGELLIGVFGAGGGGGEFDGSIDDIAVWDVALDADAITAIYNSGTPTDLRVNAGNYDIYATDLVAYYWMGDSNDTIDRIVDRSSFCNHALPQNMEAGDISSSAILLEGGDYLLLENADNILLE